jgi:hypothetical protein
MRRSAVCGEKAARCERSGRGGGSPRTAGRCVLRCACSNEGGAVGYRDRLYRAGTVGGRWVREQGRFALRNRPCGAVRARHVSPSARRKGSPEPLRKRETALQRRFRSPLPDSNRRPLPYHGFSRSGGGSPGCRIWFCRAIYRNRASAWLRVRRRARVSVVWHGRVRRRRAGGGGGGRAAGCSFAGTDLIAAPRGVSSWLTPLKR